MALFRKKTCAEFLHNIRELLTAINTIQDPKSIPQARLIAKRALGLLKNVFDLNVAFSRELEKRLLLLSVATTVSMLQTESNAALTFLTLLDQACAERFARKELTVRRMAMARGRLMTYGRIMSTAEFKRLLQVRELESPEPKQSIPAFLASPKLIEFFMKIDKTAVHNLYVKMGGTGAVDYIVFFKTRVLPVQTGGLRKLHGIQEVKFAHGTPIEIVQVRRV